jgi:hypothetical protein
MPSAEQAREDLQFVRRAVDRSAGGLPLSIGLLWAVVSLVGFSLIDLAPAKAAVFWLVAPPVGFLLSLWLGWRSARAAGEQDQREGWRWAAHWGGLLVAIGLASLLVATEQATWSGFGAMVLLLLAVAYFTAGVHLHRGLLPVAGLLAAGFPAVLYLERWAWTALGLAMAAALIASALPKRARRAA